jgi:hypothetical protein
LTVVQTNYILILVLGSILSVLISANTVGVVFGPSAVGQPQDDVTITKSLSSDKFGLGDSAIVTISVKSNSSSHIKNVSLTDIVPPMFLAEPKELFSNNVLIKQLSPFEKSNVVMYVISPGKNVELSKNWTFPLSPARITFKVDNSSATITKYSNSPSVTLIAKPEHQDWINTYWPLYLFILVLIATGCGAFGGAISNSIRYRSQGSGVISKVVRESNDYVFEVEYDNFIELDSVCNIKVTSYAKNPVPAPVAPSPKVPCRLYCDQQKIHEFDVDVGRDKDNPLESKGRHPVTKYDAYWQIQIPGLESIEITVQKRSLAKDILAGFAAGFITLLFLIVTTNLVSNTNYPANLISITTLSVSAFIAGFIPLQIIDKATGQLQERLKIYNADNAKLTTENIRVSGHLTMSKIKGTEFATYFEDYVEQNRAAIQAAVEAEPLIMNAIQRARDFKSFLQSL